MQTPLFWVLEEKFGGAKLIPLPEQRDGAAGNEGGEQALRDVAGDEEGETGDEEGVRGDLPSHIDGGNEVVVGDAEDIDDGVGGEVGAQQALEAGRRHGAGDAAADERAEGA